MSSKSLAFKSTAFDAARLMKVPQHKLPPTNTATITPRLSRRKPCENGLGKSMATSNNLSPLRSPQLIRTKNWINSTNSKVSSGGSSTCSDESIIPKYDTSSTANASQKRAYNFSRVTTTKKLLNSARNTAMVFEQQSSRVAHTASTKVSDTKFLSRNCEANKSFKSTINGKAKVFKPAMPSSGCSSSSSSLSSMTKSTFSSKFPNGLPFEDEFYHNSVNYRRTNASGRNNMRIASSVASDKSSSSLSNNSQNNDGHDENEPYFCRQSSPYDSDVMYVDFTLKSTVDKLKQTTAAATASKKTTASLQPKLSAVKTTYYINDRNVDNCFCEFESIKGTNGAFKKIIDSGKQEQRGNEISFANALDKRQNNNKDSVVYIALAWWVTSLFYKVLNSVSKIVVLLRIKCLKTVIKNVCLKNLSNLNR